MSPSAQAATASEFWSRLAPLLALGLLIVVLGALIGASWPRRRGRATPSHTEVDVVAHLVDRHQRLARLTRIAIDCTDDRTLYAAARDIELALVERAGRMRGWIDAWGAPTTGGAEHDDGWAALCSLRGPRFDRQFIETALRHLGRAVETADLAVANTSSEVLRDLLDDMVSDLRDHRRRVESLVSGELRRRQPRTE